MQITSQNPQIAGLNDSGNEFNVLLVKHVPKTNTHSAVVRVSCSMRDAIRSNRNRVYVGINSCRVFDRFYVKRCNKCQKFGHFQINCPNQKTCGYCSGSHESDSCTLKEAHDITKLKCANCKHDGLPDCGHSTFWHQCPSYMNAQKKLKSTIPYYDAATTSNSNLNQ